MKYAGKSVDSRWARLVPVAVFALISLPSTLGAQGTSGSISGIVQDSQGAVIPRAKVTALNQDQNAVNGSIATDSAGVFAFPNLPAPATYTLTVEVPGFERYSQRNIALGAGAQRGLAPFVLKIGTLSDSVTVEADTVQLETVTAMRSQSVSQQQIADLPVSGRTNIATAYLREVPGAPPDSSSNINGLPAVQQTVTMDGVTFMDMGNAGANFSLSMEAIGEVKVVTNSMGAEYGRSGGFQVSSVLKSGSKDYHATGYWYHKNEGLNANSWTNNYLGIGKPISRALNSGFTVGGPVWMPFGPLKKLGRNRVFFFSNFEFDPTKNNSVQQLTMPTLAQVGGDFSGVRNSSNQLVVVKDPLTGSPFPNNLVPANRINPIGAGLLKLLATNGTPNVTGQPSYNYQNTLPTQRRPVWQDIYKFDWNITANNRLSFHFLRYHNNYTSLAGGNLSWSYYPSPDGERSYAFNFVSVINPTMTNEFVFGEGKNFLPQGLPESISPFYKANWPGWGSAPVLYPDADPYKLISAFSFGSSGIANAPSWAANNSAVPYVNEQPIRNFSDNLTKVAGGHTIKAGVFMELATKNQSSTNNPFGSYNFQVDSANPGDTGWAFSNALLGNYDTFTQQSRFIVSHYNYRNYEWYVQDSWKLRPNLTINAGLRMALLPPWSETNDNLAIFKPSLWDSSASAQVALYQPYCANGAASCSNAVARNPLTGQTLSAAYIGTEVIGVGNNLNGMVQAGTKGVPRGLMDTLPPQLAPRVGFSWSPEPKTVIRGGAGIFHTRIELDEILQAVNAPPVNISSQLNYGNISELAGGTRIQGVTSALAIASDGKVPTSYNFNLGIQRVLPSNVLLDVSYVGTIANHLIGDVQYNVPALGSAWLPQNQNPTLATTASTILGANALPANFFRPYVGVGGLGVQTNTGAPGTMVVHGFNSNYNSLQISVQRRAGRRFTFGAHYTWSKALGTISGDFQAVNPFNTRAANYGPLSFDRRQFFNIDYTYNIPDGARGFLNNIVGKELLNGWQLSGITGFSAGAPLTAGYSYLNVSSAVLNQEITGSPDIGPRGQLICNPTTSGPHTIQQYINTSCIVPANKGSIGADSGVGAFRGLGYRNWDASLMKRFFLGNDQKRSLSFRFEAYNVFNHTEWSSFNATPTFNQTTGAITNFQSYVPGQGGGWNGYGALNAVRPARSVQLGARVSF
jgi:Carboxypeptidase regulatory-like domain